MRRRIIIVLAITFMVALLVAGFSYLYITELLQQRVLAARATASYLDNQLAYLANNADPDLNSTRIDTSNAAAMKRAITYYLGTDQNLNTMLESVVGSWPVIYDAAIVDNDNKAILHTDADLNGKPIS